MTQTQQPPCRTLLANMRQKGINYELWKKAPSSTNYERVFNQVSASGLLVISSGIGYLVSDKHVANDVGEDAEIVVHGDNNAPITNRLSAMSQSPFGLATWICHSNADIAIHPIFTGPQLYAIPLDDLESGQNLPSRDEPVTVLGFPLGIGAEGEFEPLSRETKRSSGLLTDENDGTKFFLLQDPAVNGYSGGPLFETGDHPILPGIQFTPGRWRCWGFVLGTLPDESGGKMARITPAFYAVDLVRQFERDNRLLLAIASAQITKK
jgi:hypothetical protein